MQSLHVRLLVDDYVRAFAFYRNVLGLPVTFGNETSGYADFRVGESGSLAVFERSEQGEAIELRPPGDAAVLVFGVDDLDVFVEAHAELLAGPPRERSDWGIRVAYLRDPEGNLIEVNEPLGA